MVNKKIALMVALLFSAAAIQANETTYAASTQVVAMPAKYNALSDLQKNMINFYIEQMGISLTRENILAVARDAGFIKS
jgi:hypothetical protein